MKKAAIILFVIYLLVQAALTGLITKNQLAAAELARTHGQIMKAQQEIIQQLRIELDQLKHERALPQRTPNPPEASMAIVHA